MKTVYDGLYTKFLGSTLAGFINGRYFPIEAPVGTIAPYVVGTIISELPRYELSHTFISVLIEFSVCATDFTTMNTISELVKDLFDDANLALTGYAQVGLMEMDSAQQIVQDGVYRDVIEYRLELEKL